MKTEGTAPNQRGEVFAAVTHRAKIGICVLTYNSEDVVYDCIASLQEALRGQPHSIVLVDNHSADGTVSRVQALFPELKVIRSSANTGYAVGNNLGAQALLEDPDVEYLAFVNPDVAVYADTFDLMLAAIRSHSRAACAGGVAVINGEQWTEGFRNKPTLKQKLIISGMLQHMPLLKSVFARYLPELKRRLYIPLSQLSSGTPVHAFNGACFLVSAAAFRTIGGFDPATFLFQEEFILSERLRRSGYEVVAAPAALYSHVSGQSIKKHPLQAFKAFINSEQRLIGTYYEWPWAVCLFVRGYRLLEYALYAGLRLATRLGSKALHLVRRRVPISS